MPPRNKLVIIKGHHDQSDQKISGREADDEMIRPFAQEFFVRVEHSQCYRVYTDDRQVHAREGHTP